MFCIHEISKPICLILIVLNVCVLIAARISLLGYWISHYVLTSLKKEKERKEKEESVGEKRKSPPDLTADFSVFLNILFITYKLYDLWPTDSRLLGFFLCKALPPRLYIFLLLSQFLQ